jgi:thioredoxin reductase (NADPH)
MSEPLGAGVEEVTDRSGAFPRLDEAQRRKLRDLGTVRSVESGDILFREGDEGYDFFVVEKGAVTIVQGYGAENRVIAVHGLHRFVGELNLVTGGHVYLTAVVRDAGEVIEVPAERIRTLVNTDPELGNVILGAFLERRSILIGMGAGLKLIGSRYSPDTRRLREFVARNRQPYQWMDLEADPEVEAFLAHMGVAPDETPVVVWEGTEVMRNPSNGELAARIGMGSRGAPPAICDLVVVGGGPAGLAAAMYGASEGLDTQAVEKVAFGGQASTSSRIENYLGFPAGISGSELAERASIQAAKFGARLVVPGQAVGLEGEEGHHVVRLASGDAATGRTVIVATGAHYNKPAVPGLTDYEGLGVYYAATLAEAQPCAGEPVLVVGGGNSAGQAAMFLSEHAGKCRLMIRGPDLGKSMSRYLVDQIEKNDRVEVVHNSEVVAVRGEGQLEGVRVRDTVSGTEAEHDVRALFIFIGASPHTEWLGGQAATDERGFLLTGRDLDGDDLAAYPGAEAPFFLETSRPGMFAVGDVHAGSIKRCASAVGEGSMAVRLVHQRLAVPIHPSG